MNAPRVSREQAELLKKVGYSEEVGAYYYEGELKDDYYDVFYNYNGSEVVIGMVSAPTLDEAARWLRDVKGWHCYADSSREWCTWYPVVVPKGGSFDTGTDGFTTHDLALSAGIDLILKKLNDGK